MINIKEKAQKLAVRARKSISKYCYFECKAYCCRKGCLLLTAKEAKLISNGKKVALEKLSILTKTEKGKYVLELGDKNISCPSLKKFKCIIHKNEKRPAACKEFPLFLWSKKRVRVSERCPAVREELLYPYLAKFTLMGYLISYGK